MRGYDRPQTTTLTLVNPEQRVAAKHPIRLIKQLAELALKELSPLFEQMYSEAGRPPAGAVAESLAVDGAVHGEVLASIVAGEVEALTPNASAAAINPLSLRAFRSPAFDANGPRQASCCASPFSLTTQA
jgi:hypothetical protein